MDEHELGAERSWQFKEGSLHACSCAGDILSSVALHLLITRRSFNTSSTAMQQSELSNADADLRTRRDVEESVCGSK
eukprot:6190212-Pleurochrysis_carterae.AAC.2